MNALLETRGLTVEIAGKTVCREFDLRLGAGEMLAVLGPNGAGKTTLLLSLAGVREVRGGEVRVAGRPLAAWPRRALARRLGLLMQDQQDAFPATVLETALIGRHPHVDFWRWESHRDVAIARRALRTVHLRGLEQRPQDALSGGERRRLAIATILAQAPDIYLLDEPSNHLDLQHQLSILNHFRELTRRRGAAVMLSLHDINLAARYCDSVLLIHGDGQVQHGPVQEQLTEENLSRLYGTRVVRVSEGGRVAYLATTS